jgi:hypothetical protein
MGKLDEQGEFISISKAKQLAQADAKAKELDQAAEPESPPKPPAETDPGPDPGNVLVDEFFVEEAGAAVLPNAEAAAEYRRNAAEGVFRSLADKVIDESAVDLTKFGKDLAANIKKILDAAAKLDTKEVTPFEPSEPVEFEPLPGVSSDAVCTSIFDVNDLAIRGRKAVSTRGYSQPVVLLDAILDDPTSSNWLLGQKLQWQQEWRHEGFTLGELVSSLSLLPNEEVSVEVSSFQRTRQEIQTETEDAKRLQLAVEQRTTDERTCTNATASDMGWSVSASASVSYPVASASVSASAYGNSSEKAEEARRQLKEATTRSTTDLSSRRAVKVTQTAEAGSESTTTRRLRNPNTCQTVTFNFFQVIKLYDVQIRIVDNRPTVLLPGVFPRFYGPKEQRRNEGEAKIRPTQVEIPVHLVEGWRTPAVFLTQYFEVDRELSRQISGWALRLRGDFARDAAGAARLWAEALVVAARFLFKIDPALHLVALARIFSDYCAVILKAWQDSAAGYGEDLGTSLQLNSNGLYLDALRGRCTACTDHDEADQYVEAMTGLEELRRLQRANQLDDQEVERRKKRLAAKDLDPFELTPTP